MNNKAEDLLERFSRLIINLQTVIFSFIILRSKSAIAKQIRLVSDIVFFCIFFTIYALI